MAKVFITGSADGLGQLAAQALVAQGHRVVLHARNEQRGAEALAGVPGAEAVRTGDLSDPEAVKELAASVNALGRFDAVIHNAGVYQASAKDIFRVNTIAPYLLTCLINRPQRLVYLSSGMHRQGRLEPAGFSLEDPVVSYSDSKLHVLLLSKAVARRWPEVYSNALDPGWVPTKMGGRGAPDDLQKGYETQVWLAVSEEPEAKVSGNYFFHRQDGRSNPQADEVARQEELLRLCEWLTGVAFPENRS